LIKICSKRCVMAKSYKCNCTKCRGENHGKIRKMGFDTFEDYIKWCNEKDQLKFKFLRR